MGATLSPVYNPLIQSTIYPNLGITLAHFLYLKLCNLFD